MRRSCRVKGLGLALWLLLQLPAAWAQPNLVELDAKRSGQVLGPQVQVLRDPEGKLSFEAVASADMTDRFQPSPDDGLNYGFTRDAYWYRVALMNEDVTGTVRDWVLEISWPPLDEVDVYVVHASGRVEHTRTGDQRPPGSSGIDHRNYAVPLLLAPGETVQLYLRVYIDGAHQLPMRVWPERAFFLKTARENLYFGMFYGTVLVMVIYNLIILLATRDRSYLYYVLFIFSLGLLQLILDGFAFPYAWAISPKLINGSLALVIALATVFVPLFIRQSLQTRRRAPRMHALLNCAIGIAFGSMILPFVLPVMEATFINAAIGAVTTVLMATVIILRAIEGDRTARFYLLVWGALVIGVVVKVLEINGLLPITVLATYALHIGLALLVTLVSLALADQINRDRVERERLVRERADAQSAAKSEFLAKMSHELRTPMNAIVGFTDLALRSHSDERRIEHLGNIDTASRAMLRIVNDVLDLTRVEAGKLELDARPFELKSLLNQVRGLVAVAARTKAIAVSVVAAPELPEVVVGDGARLQQVLMNLMGNAVKFTEQGEVELSVTQRLSGGGKVLLRFEVRDTGIGITPEQLQTLFTPFTQGDQSITRKYGGSGLGLVISKQLVELMGGQIVVESVAGKGSHFSFELPFKVGQALEAPLAAEREDVAHMASAEQVRGACVLLVEDNAMNRRLASEILSEAGVRVDIAENGEEAVAAVLKQPYDCVLMDVQMPVMDGFKATHAIRLIPHMDTLPIIAMTANAMAQDREQALACGMNDFLPKPIDADALLNMLKKWITSRGKTMANTPQDSPVGNNELPASLPGLDLADAMRRLGGRKKLLLELLGEFAIEQAGVADEIEAFIKAGDQKAAERAAHSLKGVAANVGCGELARAAQAVEDAIKLGETRDLGEKLDVVREAFAQARASIAQLPTAPDSAAPVASGNTNAQLDQLADMLQRQDFGAGALLEGLAPSLRVQFGTPQVEALSRALKGFDFSSASTLLAQMREGRSNG